MKPEFGMVNIIRVRKADYAVGDVVSLKTHDGIYHCHRIISIDANTVTTKGDNLEMQKYEIDVPIKNIEGRVTLIRKFNFK